MDALQITILAVVSLYMLARPQTHTRAAVAVVAVMWAASLAMGFSGWSLSDWGVTAVAAAGLGLAYWAPPWLRADIPQPGATGADGSTPDEQARGGRR